MFLVSLVFNPLFRRLINTSVYGDEKRRDEYLVTALIYFAYSIGWRVHSPTMPSWSLSRMYWYSQCFSVIGIAKPESFASWIVT